MAGEALQILNLSPIPELSEVELSNVLEQFSELSELTGDLTDRNVEDILREAEELLDMSSSVQEMSEEIQNDDFKQKEEVEIKVKETNLSDEKKSEDKVMESPEQPLSARLISPSSSKNHIKSTIDSLKECSKIIEDQINSKTDCKKEEKHAKSIKNLPSYDVPTKINKVFTRLTSPVQKQSKNLSIPGKQKHIERLSKTANVRKTFNDFKSGSSNSVCKNKLQSKGINEKRKRSPFSSPIHGSPLVLQKNNHHECLDFKYGDENEVDFEKCIALLDKELLLGKNDSKFAEQLLKDSKESVSMLQKEIADLKAQLLKNKVSDRNSELEQTFRAQKDLISSLKEENTKLFQEIEEIKGQMRIAENLEKTLKDKQDVIENLRSEIESLRDCVMSKGNSSPGLSRLEERFQVIKDKYNQQIEKLELENQQLKHALNHPHLEHDNDFSHDSEEKRGKEIGVQTERSPVPKPTKLIRSTSFENWRSGKPKLWDNVRSLENGNGEAICQTERETRNASVQSEEISAPKEKKVPADHVLEPRKIDNKENMIGKPPKPNLDRKKGMSEHELHLMATLRGLHAEILAKDKENRKLKNELDTLKNQTKKLGGDAGKKKTVQTKKKIHAGTQTIGLGPCVPAAYDPALFQVSKELENENEELKAKIKALEEEGVQLKNKRISDLQILQEIHEQEMAKLESKLQSQTALAKHLHTLLLNR